MISYMEKELAFENTNQELDAIIQKLEEQNEYPWSHCHNSQKTVDNKNWTERSTKGEGKQKRRSFHRVGTASQR